MGEIAEGMVNGESCEWCGTSFRKAHGYPVLCKSCWKDATPAERKQHQQAKEREV